MLLSVPSGKMRQIAVSMEPHTASAAEASKGIQEGMKRSHACALCTGGFPHKTAMAFSGSLFMVSVGLVLFTCGGPVYPKEAPEEERYRVIRCAQRHARTLR